MLRLDTTSRWFALAESLLVALIWSSSFVLVKAALPYTGPLMLAGLRYFVAFLVLLPFMLRRRQPAAPLSSRTWLQLAALGLSAYTLGNGAVFWALKYLPATTTSFLLSFTPLLVLLASLFWLKEIPTRWQVAGMGITMAGSALFFSGGLQPGEPLGLLGMAAGLVGFAAFGALGRGVARTRQVDTLSLTAIPLAIGGAALLGAAVPAEGWPAFSWTGLGIVLWLAVVNTAAAYMLYNHALKTLTAVEMNIMLNLSPLGTALLAWFFLGETLTWLEIAGICVMILGVILVQQRGKEI